MPTGVYTRKSTCPQGHEFTAENTRIKSNGYRSCRICDAEQNRRQLQRRRKLGIKTKRSSKPCGFPGCKNAIGSHGLCQGHNYQRKTGKELTELRQYGRFGTITCDEVNGCHVARRTMDTGYGYVSLNGEHVLSHRLTWEREIGPIPDGMKICHMCDNPPCCNPDHLFLGTDADNVDDKVRKGRQLKGEQIAQAKLTESDVMTIRDRVNKGESQTLVGKDYDVDQSTISDVARRVHWKHI